MISRSSFCVAAVLSQLSVLVYGAVHEQLAAVPSGWSLVGTPDAGTTITLTVALAHQNLDQLESTLLGISTPGHSNYCQHLDVDDVNALFPPANDAAVVSWLQGAGISSIHSNGSSVNFATTVSTANKLLSAEFAYYQSGSTKKLRTVQYSIPESLASDIELVSPTTYFGKTTAARAIPSVTKSEKRAPAAQVSVAPSCQKSITPSCLKQLYNINDYTPDPNCGSRIAFGSFLNESAQYSDLALFEKYFGIPSQNFSVELINGGVNEQDLINAMYGEANLDVEYIVGISSPLPVTEFITGGSPPFVPNLDEPLPVDNENEPYLPYYEYLLSKSNAELPQVISNSYGDDEQTVPQKYATRVCNLIGMLGARGISVLESSGDTGIGAPCQSNDGKKTPQFTPQFPGTCPYITAVGGTQSVSPEIAWVGSSGGFSNYFSRPWYQELAVEYYLNFQISPSTKAYYNQYTNFAGRGFPDVSAHSLTPDFLVFENGTLGRTGGTSAACPTFSATIALLNDARLRAGKPTLGFLNPFLYLLGFTALNDITGGSSVGCDGINPQSGQPVPGGSIIPFAHWNATTGWDPVTGLGTPDFEKLKALVLAF